MKQRLLRPLGSVLIAGTVMTSCVVTAMAAQGLANAAYVKRASWAETMIATRAKLAASQQRASIKLGT